MRSGRQFPAGLAAAAVLGSAAAAVPPPPPLRETILALPADQCRLALTGVVRAYAQPAYLFEVSSGTVVRLLAERPDPALLFDLERADGAPVAMGAGLAGQDVRVALPAPGRYRLRLLITGDAARIGRQVGFRLSLSRAPESGAAECRDGAGD